MVLPNYATIGGDQPVGIASLSAMLKKNGFPFDFFDTSFVLQDPMSHNKYSGHIKVATGEEPSVQLDLEETLKLFLTQYDLTRYDLFLVSTMTATHPSGKEFIRVAKEKNPHLFVVVGGIHATVLPEETLADPNVDAICVGEGEQALLDFLRLFSEGKSFTHVENFWFKSQGKIIRNKCRLLCEPDTLAHPDYSIFRKEHFYRPFAGKIYRSIAVEISRGCPFRCSYCVNKYLQTLYVENAQYHRRNSVEVAIEKLAYIKEEYKAEFFRFVDESFAIMSVEYLEKFSKLYAQRIGIPFWVQTSATTLTERKVQLLKEMNCAAVTIGVEHGDEKFRRTVLNKNVTDEQIFNAMSLLKKYELRRSAYFIIGLPFETRDLVFKTISMYRKLIREYGAAPSTVHCFYPFPGTELLDVCLKNHFISGKMNANTGVAQPSLDMPKLSYDAIAGLKRTFFAYSVMDEKLYPVIRCLEETNPYTEKILEQIAAVYSS